MRTRAAWGAEVAALGHRLHARLAGRARAPAGPFVPPEPRGGGEPSRGRALLAGQVRLGPRVVDLPGTAPGDGPQSSIWALGAAGGLGDPGDPAVADLHACRWLDDLAALGTAPARALAQAWVADWISRYGGGRGPGWTPELTAWRTLTWMGHGAFLQRGRDAAAQEALALSLARQALFLQRRWRRAPAGLPRIAALAAQVEAGLALPALRRLVEPVAGALGDEAAATVDAGGAVASRSPEEILDVLALLTRTAAAMAAAGLAPAAPHRAAIARAAPTLRALRHADGGLGRFHGGDRGAEGRLDQVLAAAGRPALSGARPGMHPGMPSGMHSGGAGAVGRAAPLHMGFARLGAGRTTVIVDAAAPPGSADAHASTLAFELTSGRRPLIVSCGPGGAFGAEWRRAARATASHSTLAIEGFSSARLGPGGEGQGGEGLVDAPRRVIAEAAPASESGGRRVELAHDGWRATHGLTHARILGLSADGRTLAGEDLLTTLTAADGALFDRALDAGTRLGLAFAIRFHLHPDVEAEVAESEVAEERAAGPFVRLVLRSGEEWALQYEGEVALTVEPSVHLEEGRLRPRPSLQVVLAGRALTPATRVRWWLSKAVGVPEGLRDVAQDEEADEPWTGEGGEG